MRPLHLCLVVLLISLFTACSHELKVVGHGPSVHDQLIGRGYITPPVDSLTTRDSIRIEQDTLR